MIAKEKLGLNLKELKIKIPSKPETYTTVHPVTIKEALKHYCNQRTVHTMQACTINLNDENWPLPLWIDPENVKVGFWNKLYYRKIYRSLHKKRKFKNIKEFDFFRIFVMNHIIFKLPYDQIIIEAFDANVKYVFRKLNANPILASKKAILESVQKSAKHQNWIACINTLFPIIDYVTRSLLKTKNLRIDVSRICKLFAENGFSLKTAGDLMPYFTFVLSHEPGQPLFSKVREERFREMAEYDFGLIGPALSSFIRFANIYYSYYKEDSETEVMDLLNRHAILHGSINNFGSKVNTVKLISFLFLMLELEPVFEILLAE